MRETELRAGKGRQLGRAVALKVFRASSRNFADMLLVPHKTSAEIAADGVAVEGDWSIIDNALNLFNVQSYYQQVVKGLIILVAVLARRKPRD